MHSWLVLVVDSVGVGMVRAVGIGDYDVGVMDNIEGE